MSRCRRVVPHCRLGRVVRAAACVLLAASLLALTPSPQASANVAEAKPTLAVALGSSLPDVGVAASLAAAGAVDAVIFSESPGSLGNAAARLVSSQQPAKVLIVGGASAVSDAVETELRRIAQGVTFERLAGTNRIHTAALAASRVLSELDDGRDLSVIIANGWSLPDVGAAASAVAAGLADAVLYTGRDSLGDHTAQALRRFGPSDILISGGSAAVSATTQTAAKVAANGANARRIGGATRTHTAALVAQSAYPDPSATPDAIILADGWSLPDVGIAASLAAALGNAAVIYTTGRGIDTASADFVGLRQPTDLYFVGTQGDTAAATSIGQIFPANKLTVVTSATASAYIALGLEPPAELDTPSHDIARAEAQMVQLVNGLRTSVGLHTLQQHPSVAAVARRWSASMLERDDFRHNTAFASQYPAGSVVSAENIAKVPYDGDLPASVAEAFQGFSDSPSHYANMIHRGLGHIGVGIAVGNGYVWVTQNFACYPPAGSPACTGGSGGSTGQPVSTYPSGYKFWSVTAGDRHTCALYGRWEASSIICWGDSSDGKLNAPDGDFTAIAAGFDHTCATRTDTTIACWGADDADQSAAPKQSGFSWRVIGAGHKHACAFDGSAPTCWGSGRASRAFESLPLTDRGVSGGGQHYCGLIHQYEIVCAGDNSHGQLDAPNGTYDFIAAGSDHSCAVRHWRPSETGAGDGVDGKIVCWGANSHGQLDVPNPVPGANARVAAGEAHSCATGWSLVQGVHQPITCWGSNTHGQLQVPPEAGRRSFVEIGAGSRHTCAIDAVGHGIVCWGDNAHGQADAPALPPPAGGTGTPADGAVLAHSAEFASLVQNLTPAAPQLSEFDTTIDAPGGPFTHVVPGPASVCGLRADGSLDCWWDDGELVTSVPSGSFSSFDADGPRGCAIRRLDGSLVCWGSDELDDASPTGTFREVSVSPLHGRIACAIRTNGRLVCWDGNPWGRVSKIVDPVNHGNGEYSGTATYVDVSVGNETACAVRADGTLDCWGWLIWGSQQRPEHPDEVQAVSVGLEGDICALKRDDSVVCITHNPRTPANPAAWRAEWKEAPKGSYRSVSVGTGYACAVTTAGAARCWRTDEEPRYDDYPRSTYGRHPENFSPPSGTFTSVTASRAIVRPRTCGIRADGSITCWGSEGSASASLDATVKSFASGEDFGCALRHDGTISCWGANWFGQTDAPAGSFTSVSAGEYHACAIRADKTVACWGQNVDGRTNAPNGAFDQVVAAAFHSCGLRTDGTVTCWGSNNIHALNAPTGTFTKIVANRFAVDGRGFDLGTTCGLRADGTVTCWGGTFEAGRIGSAASGLPEASSATPLADFDLSPGYWCAVRTDGIVQCEGFNCGSQFFAPAPQHHCYTDENSRVLCEAPSGDPFAHTTITRFGACASTDDGRWTCFGEGVHEIWPPGGAHDISPRGSMGCAKRPDGTWTCSGTLRRAVWDPFDRETYTLP